MATFLHVECGPKRKDKTTPGVNTDLWTDQRSDIDETVKPDLVGTMTDMSAVNSGTMDAIYSSHNIEHLYPHEVPLALKEFLRALNDAGFTVITCRYQLSACALVAQDKLTDAAYTSPAGPRRTHHAAGHPLRPPPPMGQGNLYMSHRCGYTQKVLVGTLRAAGFASAVALARSRAPYFDLWDLASKAERSEQDMRDLAR